MKKYSIILGIFLMIFSIAAFCSLKAHAQNPQPFQMGAATLADGNTVEWGVSGGAQNLTLFATKKWNGTRPGGKSRLAVTVFDKSGNAIATEYSLTVTPDFPSFGTVTFKQLTQNDVSRIGSFSVRVEAVQ